VHEFGFTDILGWLFHGVYQLIRYIAPYISPDPETGSPPSWWYRFWTPGDWYWNLDGNQVPNWDWIWRWRLAAYWLLEAWIQEIGEWAWDYAVDVVRYFTGYVRHNYSTFENWCAALRSRTGTWVPWWASDLANAAQALYLWLPESIRSGWESWAQIWDTIKDDVWGWVQDRYEEARQLAYDAINWITDLGQAVRTWYDIAHNWLDDFRSDPWGHVTGWLGEPWQKLVTFCTGALTFFYNLWGTYAPDIGAFWDNPLLWLYDRAEDFVLDWVF